MYTLLFTLQCVCIFLYYTHSSFAYTHSSTLHHSPLDISLLRPSSPRYAQAKGGPNSVQEFDELGDDEENSNEFDPISPSGPMEVNNYGEVWLPQPRRPRRNRKTKNIRNLLQENVVRTANLVYPIFIHDEEFDEPIDSMPGQKRLSFKSLCDVISECRSYGLKSFAIFPSIKTELKTIDGQESFNPDGLLPQTLEKLKTKFDDITLFTDVALDPYTSTHQDGVLDEETNEIMNDYTVYQLCKQALVQAQSGSDVVSPSDMMDGRVSAIRDTLDTEGYTHTSIMSYSAKYASSLYSPFRNALKHKTSKIDKKSYQMDPSNGREAEIEASLDITEGADMLMVKPGLFYLDIVRRLHTHTHIPISVYHVSGEYAMIKAAAHNGWLNEKEVVLEAIKSMKRAGANFIFTYFAKDVAKWLSEDTHTHTHTRLSSPSF